MINATIIITTRNEPWLKWTVENIRRTCHPQEVLIVYDGLQKVDEFDGATHIRTPWTTPQGVGKCRDLGIMAMQPGYAVLLDSHMDFDDNWLLTLVNTCKRNENSVVCSKSRKIVPPHGMKRAGKLLAGAYIRETGLGTGQPLEVEWGTEPLEPGEIQCCLGACYCISKKRYLDLGRPWAKAFGWGSSEQTLCLVNSLCGGVNVLADVETGHYYMDKTERGYKPDADFKIGAIFNRLRLVRLFYRDNERERMAKLNKTIRRSKFAPYAEKAIELLGLTDDSDILDRMTVTQEEYAQKWWKDVQKVVENATKCHIEYNTDKRDERFV